jgi:hypothetical protein
MFKTNTYCGTVVVTSILESFDKGIFSHGNDSAYPPDRSPVVFPSALTAQWSNASLVDMMAFALRNISDTIHSAALADGHKGVACCEIFELRPIWHATGAYVWWKLREASQDQGGD